MRETPCRLLSKRLDPDGVVNMGFCGTVRLDPDRDPNAETSRWNQRSGDQVDLLIFAKNRGKKGWKALCGKEKTLGRTFVISRSPVQVRPVAPLAPGFRKKTGCFVSKNASKMELFLHFGPKAVWVSVWVKRLTQTRPKRGNNRKAPQTISVRSAFRSWL